jgi:hypothetical protein
VLGADCREGIERPRLDLGGRSADILEPERDLVQDAREDDLVLRILKERRDGSGERRRAVASRVEAGDLDPARERAAVEMRHERGEGAEERRLAGAGRAEYRDDLSRCQARGHVPQRRLACGRVRKRQMLDAR